MSVMRGVRAGAEAAGWLVGFAWTISVAEDLEHALRYHHWPRWVRRWTLLASWTECTRCREKKA